MARVVFTLALRGHILPRGVTSADDGDMGQKQMALFALLPLVQRYAFAPDPGFARRVYPLVKGVAEYWLC